VGILNAPSRPRQNSRSAFLVTVAPGWHTTTANTASPKRDPDTGHRHFGHRRMLHQHCLDLQRIDLLAAAVDHVLLAVEDIEKPAVVLHADIAGV
jgi:hypothetical protein